MPRAFPMPGGAKVRPGEKPVQKPKDAKKTLLRLWKYLSGYRWLLIAAFVLTVSGNLLALVGPMLSGGAIDAIGKEAGGVIWHTVLTYCAYMLVFYIASSVLSYILSFVMISLSRRVTYRMRRDLFNHLTELPVSFFDRHQTGDIISRLSYDIDTINSSLSNDLVQIAASIITVAGSLVMMIIISPPLVSVFAVTIPVSIAVTKYMTGKVRPLFRERSSRLGELNGYAEEIVTGQKVIKAYRREGVFAGRFRERNEAASQASYRAEYYGSMVGPSVNFINNLSLSLVSSLGALLYVLRWITPGNLSSFVLYSRRFSGPINEIANIISELQSACSAAERVFATIDEPAEPADSSSAAVLDRVAGQVSMQGIQFGYLPETPVIRNLDLTADSGSLVAIVGPTGAGKTTLINLLMRFYDPQSGIIRIDGTDIRNVTRDSLRLAYSMVLQDTWLFHGTVFENITYGRQDATMEQVTEAARSVHIHEYIMSLPDGYDTVLSEDGMNISQGQKQLITIARAMLLDAPMLILDEATSNVDTRTETYIRQAMTSLTMRRNGGQRKTCFIVAHRLSTIQGADIILVVRDGDIAEQGTHNELLNRGGIYAELFHSQFR